MSRQKDLAKNTAILTFGKICTQCISFLLLPLYTAMLDTSDYGTFDLLVTYGTLLLPLVNWQFDQGIFRFMLDWRGDKEMQTKLFSTICIANTIQAIIFVLVMELLSIFVFIEHKSFLMAYVVLHIYTGLLLQFARGLGRSKAYAMASFVSASATIILNVVMLVGLRKGVEGLFIATLSAQVLTIFYLIVVLKPWQYFGILRIEKNIFISVSKYSLPLIPNNLSWWIVNVSDRTIVSYVLGVSINGIYTVANKFSNVFINFYNIFNLSWTETVSLHYQDEDRDEFLSEMITTLYKLFSSACFGIVAFMPFIFPLMVNEKYNDAYPQIIILMYAMLLRVVVGLYSCIYVAMKESKKIAYTSAISAVINIVVNLLLIGKIGLYAASLSTLVAFGSMAVVRYFDINKTVRMRIDKKVLIGSLILAIVLALSYAVNQMITNIIMIVIVCFYSYIMNKGMIFSAFVMIKKRIRK